MCLDRVKELQIKEASLQLSKTPESCRQYWKKHKITLLNDPELRKLYGKTKTVTPALTTTEQIILYRHMTYYALKKDNLRRASEQINKPYSACNNFWLNNKKKWKKSESLQKNYGALFCKSLPIDPDSHRELETFQVDSSIIELTTSEVDTSIIENFSRSHWKKHEEEILYEEMSYKGFAQNNYKMASKRLTGRTPKACKEHWCQQKEKLRKKFLDKYGDVATRYRLIPENRLPKSPKEVTAYGIIPNVDILASSNESGRVATPVESIANSTHNVTMPMLNMPVPPPITYIQNHLNFYPPFTANNPVMTTRYGLPLIENNSPWSEESFERLINFMITPKEYMDKQSEGSLILRNHSAEQCQMMWEQRANYIYLYMASLVSQVGYRPWTEEENNAFDATLKTSDPLHINLKNISLLLNRPFIECFGKWEANYYRQMNRPV